MSISRRELLKLGASSLIFIVAGQVFFGEKVSAEVARQFNDLDILNLLKDMPKFDGIFTIETNALKFFADDFGHSIHKMPLGALQPAHSIDIQKMAEFCLEKKVKLTIRGSGGSAYGQSQVSEGIIIDSTSMKEIMWLSQDLIQLGPGVTWKELLEYSLQSNRTPYVLPDNLNVTVGGSISAGGIGNSSFSFGSMVDHVVEFDLVTIEGVHLTCSEEVNADLFQAALGSMGQLGYITRIVLRTMAAPSLVKVKQFRYDGLDYRYLNDLQMITQNLVYGAIDGRLVRNEGGQTFSYILEVAHWEESDPEWLQNLSTPQSDDDSMDYLEWVQRDTEVWRHLTSQGKHKCPHPYLSFFIPFEKSQEMSEFLQKNTLNNFGASQIKVSPLVNDKFQRSLFRFSDQGLTAYFRLERTVKTGEGSADHLQMLKTNEEILLPKIFELGGKVHLPLSPIISISQLESQFSADQIQVLSFLKHKYDAENLVNVGAGLF